MHEALEYYFWDTVSDAVKGEDISEFRGLASGVASKIKHDMNYVVPARIVRPKRAGGAIR